VRECACSVSESFTFRYSWEVRELAKPDRQSTVLLGDIGGSNCRLAIYDVATRGFVDRLNCSTGDYPSPAEAISALLSRTAARPSLASLALACPVSDDQPQLTNTSWRFNRADLMTKFGWDSLVFVNDLVAQARAVHNLGTASFIAIGTERVGSLPLPALVIGPGTGLGIAQLEATGVTASEGGHAGFSPSDDVEAGLHRLLSRDLGRVTNEHVISGPGIVRLYRALGALTGREVDAISGPEIARRAVAKECVLCVDTCERFAQILGAVAGDAALMLSSSSVVLVGGIITTLTPFLQLGGFRKRFEQRGPGASFQHAVPTYVTHEQNLGLRGALNVLMDLGVPRSVSAAAVRH
jgi:glucokinase